MIVSTACVMYQKMLGMSTCLRHKALIWNLRRYQIYPFIKLRVRGVRLKKDIFHKIHIDFGYIISMTFAFRIETSADPLIFINKGICA